MSLSYTVAFDCPHNIETAADVFVQECGFSVDPTHTGRSPRRPTVTLLAHGLYGDVFRLDASYRKIHADQLRIDVNTHFLLWPPEALPVRSGEARLLASVVAAAVRMFSGDLAFLFEGERVLMLRRGATVIVDSATPLWNEVTLPAFTFPYELKELGTI